MNVKLAVKLVMRMQTVITLMAAILVPVHLDTLEMAFPAMVRSLYLH